MTRKKLLPRLIAAIFILCGVIAPRAAHAGSAQMSDYCQVPPFIGVTEPNLLLMIDNSASMYDLQYTENSSYKTCTGTGSTSSGCASGETCVNGTCQNTYCFDNSYNNSDVCIVVNQVTCTTDSDCPSDSGETCTNNVCTVNTSCVSDADCAGITGATCQNRVCQVNCTANSQCSSDQECLNQYAGYFDATKVYTSDGLAYSDDISSSNTDFPQFDESSFPDTTTCTYRAADSSGNTYLCVQDNTATGGTYDLYATGKFLDWLTASKMDVQKLILTGGKYVSKVCSTSHTACTSDSDCPSGETCDTTNTPFLQEESRGCVGHRYVKEPPSTDWTTTSTLTFGVRGDISSDPSQPSTGGITRIDLFNGDFSGSTCQDAVTCWTNCCGTNNCGTCKLDTANCLNINARGGASATWNHALQTCWTCGHQPCCPEDIANDDILRITGTSASYSKNPECGAFVGDSTAMSALLPTDPQYVCLYDQGGTNITSSTFSGGTCSSEWLSENPYPGEAGDYVGTCFFQHGNNGSFSWDDTCVQYQFANYCRSIQVGQVIDPTLGPDATLDCANIPGNLVDAGLVGQLDDPIRTYDARVSVSSAPTGLIDDFKTQIRFGAMEFNTYGSAAECANNQMPSGTLIDTCSSASNEDGGAVVSQVGETRCSVSLDTCSDTVNSSDCPTGQVCEASVGDHTVGLINVIDNAKASTWTPYSEAFYNAIGYFGYDSSTGTIMRLNSGDFSVPTTWPSPITSDCQKNNVLLITDGQPTADLNSSVSGLITNNLSYFPTSNYNKTLDSGYDTSPDSSCYQFAGSRNLDDLAWLAQNEDIQDITTGSTLSAPIWNSHKINTYVVYSGSDAISTDNCASDTDAQLAALDQCNPSNLMCVTARHGGGTYYQASDPTSLKTQIENALLQIAAKASSGTAASVLASGEGSGANLVQALFYPRREFDFNTETYWSGTLQNLWYYIDPFFTNSNIREDTDHDAVLDLTDDYVADPQYDSTTGKTQVPRYEDTSGTGSPLTYVDTIPIEDVNNLWEAGKELWAMPANDRKIYTSCDLQSATCLQDGSGNSYHVINFTTSNKTVLEPYLQASTADDASKLISWVRGYDLFCTGTTTPCTADTASADCGGDTCTDEPYRMRTVSIDENGNRAVDSGETNVWKLGDIVNSTPRVASWVPLNHYNLVNGDVSYGPLEADLPYGEDSEAYFNTSSYDASPAGAKTPGYRDRGVVFSGANDGMLHAFRLGTIELTWTGQGNFEKARLLRTCINDHTTTCTQDSDCPALSNGSTAGACPELGQELWAFIPKSVLPYLTYMANKNYCHVYSMDLTPYIFDASIEGPDTTCTEANYYDCTRDVNSWRTIVIGGMRYGGACKARVCSTTTTTKCASDSDCPAGEACVVPSTGEVTTPILDPDSASSPRGVGYSSYFALDVTKTLTDPSVPPTLMWEFSNEELGFSTSGPAIVRIGTKVDTTGNGVPDTVDPSKDGRWLVVIGSGPTGPIANDQFSGSSDQPLRFFVLDLKTGQMINAGSGSGCSSSSPCPMDTGISNAFAGSMFNATLDVDKDYTDDVLYTGYVKKCASDVSAPDHGCTAGTWTDGGVLRIVTKGDSDPSNWVESKVIDGTGPITAAVAKLTDKNNGRLWLYFGAGRYYYKTSTDQDDMDNQRSLYGVTDPCFDGNTLTMDTTCTSSRQTTDLEDMSSTGTPSTVNTDGWFIALDGSSTDSTTPENSLGAERVITDPLATTTGAVFFTTFQPYTTLCKLGGKSYLWAVKYDTGGAAGAILKGKAILQVSTGAIPNIDISTEFTQKSGRKTAGMEGVPPVAQGLSLITSPPPVKRVLHVRER